MKNAIDSLGSSQLNSTYTKENAPVSGLSGFRGSVGLALMTVLAACKPEDLENVDYGSLTDGTGGGQPCLTLPFEPGQDWVLTRGYGTEVCGTEDDGNYITSHCDWGFFFGDDQYALDFSMSGCTKDEYGKDEDYLAYGQPVYPIAAGTIEEITYEGNYDHGYGNSVIIYHENNYFSRYAHLSEISDLEFKESVSTSTKIGEVGNTGNTKGDACPVHPGTHLHVAFYKLDEDHWAQGIPPEPISGYSNMSVWSTYERDGNETNSSTCDESEWEDSDDNDDGDGSLNITFTDVSPHSGSENETAFVWVAIVERPDDRPEATLWIHNPDHGVDYDFEMDTESEESPWVFTYRKTLNDNLDYPFWVEASGENGSDVSDKSEVDVDGRTYDEPEYEDQSWDSEGEAGETEFEWISNWESDEEPDVELKIVNAQDAQIYSFDMDVSGHGDSWEAIYEKTLRDPVVYTFWMEADNGESTNTTDVRSVEVTD